MFGASYWLLLTALVAYFVYTLTSVCPINDPSPLSIDTLFHKSPVTYHTCVLSHEYLKPVYLAEVLPRYQHNVEPVLKDIDSKLHLTFVAQSLRQMVDSVARNHRVAAFVENRIANAQYVIDGSSAWLEPRSTRLRAVARGKLAYYWALAKVYLHQTVETIQVYYYDLSGKVAVAVQPYSEKVLDSEWVASAVFWFNRLVEAFWAKANSHYLQEKRDFIKSEFKNLVKFDEFGLSKSQPVDDIASLLVEEPTASSEDEIERVTIVLTSTLTATATPTEVGISVEDYQDYDVIKLNQELELWDGKVARTLEMAANNLEVEMKPVIDQAILSIKDDISSKMQQLQVENYKQYQQLNKMIKEISKDYERIEQTNDTTIESVTRQEVRDVIAKSYQLPEELALTIQNEYLIKAHEYVTNNYFRVIQDTIDILETFAENTIQDFSKLLTTLLAELNFENEEIDWQAWKQFHRVKEQLFDFRDSIMDTANEYKLNKSNNKELQTIGLQVWNEYLKNVEFHINFLLRDNDDYLKLARAKANVAFQLREGLVRGLEAKKVEEEPQAQADPIESQPETSVEEPIETQPEHQPESIENQPDVSVEDSTDAQPETPSVEEAIDSERDVLVEDFLDDQPDSIETQPDVSAEDSVVPQPEEQPDHPHAQEKDTISESAIKDSQPVSHPQSPESQETPDHASTAESVEASDEENSESRENIVLEAVETVINAPTEDDYESVPFEAVSEDDHELVEETIPADVEESGDEDEYEVEEVIVEEEEEEEEEEDKEDDEDLASEAETF
ncbi:uncharacterized protein CANTADRAFT_21291 [Suhomyces tanzawaensis NRRL Y-17324]|uniref:Outer spore wall assembly protein SHE10 n=1 Tax=Suhomyces tanzawaensis NRRL Y-17324 TaxID=984487 RepID=A0A1E4SKR1_9ASCO|nr:uncharacterized protein CANTADRAFT_21291 [Suhomyces tanzawaensis NRRL Y-17324]ODV80027.1 hypothetical protein CANTADRAFT_21291 [Suhomyces tanzawaensis NRRL Y-17324]